MTQVIRFEISYLEKPWNPILNQSNIEGKNWKKNIFNYRVFKKKIAIKRMIIKIEIQFFYYFLLKYEIEKKNQLKKTKQWGSKLK
jgi:hypothetical protein